MATAYDTRTEAVRRVPIARRNYQQTRAHTASFGY